MSLELMYITNNLDIALIAEKAGVDRVWIDLEKLGKEERQKGMNTVKSNHSVSDIKVIAPKLTRAKMQVRVNPINDNSYEEINQVIEAGADYIMLPMWTCVEEVKKFLGYVNKRAKTILLLETIGAQNCLDEVLRLKGIDEIHIGLNDLHLEYHLSFMFELLANGTIDSICEKIKKAGIPFGFGGISHLHDGLIPAEMVITEHYRIGSSRAILSRGFCDISTGNLNEIEKEFNKNMKELKEYEHTLEINNFSFEKNRSELKNKVEYISNEKKKQTYSEIKEKYGDAFYLLNSKQFMNNFRSLKKAFNSVYNNFNIAYSYKTNYIPRLCKIVDDLGGYAEVVSEMELELALKIGVKPENIIWNGPIKNNFYLEKYLKLGVTVNIDNMEEEIFIRNIVIANKNTMFNLGIRCNYDVKDGIISRFGFDVDSEEFKDAIDFVSKTKNVNFVNFQCHFAKRSIEYWKYRTKGMIEVIKRTNLHPIRIDIGGGLYGKMHPDLLKQFNDFIPSYSDYANVVATEFAKEFNGDYKPQLVIEPGSALVGDCMSFVGTVKNIKNVRGKYYATVLGSQKNISMGSVNPPIEVVHMDSSNQEEYSNLDFVGFTCIEGDVLYRNYSGKLKVNDLLVINNCGSYSIVMKPPFILPNFPIIDISQGSIELIKKQETFENIFDTYVF